MSRIPLRDYILEIENLVENDENEDAIAHSRQITQVYPKNLAANRLLGKAHLALRQDQEASAAFQQVLDAAPDDSIAHLGLSVICENQGDLDASIRHMERAFDVQPAKATIQSELRRLYKARDGLEPQKIHLSRGALARMYAKGDLYPQAIAELRAALGEDPQRPDLQLVLAKMYAKSGLLIEAADACSTLLRKLPNCMEAHLILGEILSKTERSAEAQLHYQLAAELDPYAAHLAPGQQDPGLAPAESVTIDRADNDLAKPAASEIPEGQEWITPVEASLMAAAKHVIKSQQIEHNEEVGMVETTNGPGDQPVEPPASEENPKDVIPDWMQSAGWEPATDAGEEPEPDFETEAGEFAEDDELVKAEIPDWLKPLAPSGAEVASYLAAEEGEGNQPPVPSPGESAEGRFESSGPPDEQGAEGELPDWMQAAEGTQPEPEGEAPDWVAIEGEMQLEPEEELPDWLKAEEEPESGLPEWLIAAEEDQPNQEAEKPVWMSALEDEQAEPEEALPDWLKSGEDGQTEPVEQAPSWLEALEAEASAQEDIPGGGAAIFPAMADLAAQRAYSEKDEQSEDAVESSEDGFSGAEIAGLAAIKAVSGDEDDSAYHSGFSEEGISDAEAGEGLAGEQEAEHPEWLTSPGDEIPGEERTMPDEEFEAKYSTQSEGPSEAELPYGASEVPDWLRNALDEQEDPQTGQPEEIPDWLRTSVPEGFPEEPPPILGDTRPVHLLDLEERASEEADMMASESQTSEEVQEVEETTAWVAAGEALSEMPEDISAEPGEFDLQDEEPQLPVVASEAGADLAGEAAALGWLESLAAREGAEEEELLTSPEERGESIPEWLEHLVSDSGAEIKVPLEDGAIEPEEQETEGSAWQPESEGAAFVEVEEEPAGGGELELEQASWHPEIETEGEGAGDATAPIEELEDPSREPVMEADTGIQAEPASTQPEAELPDWLRDFVDEDIGGTIAEEVAVEAVLEPVDLNTATLSQLERVPGVGYILAQNIINYRESHGPLKNRADLESVPGISQEAIDQFEAWGAFERPADTSLQVEALQEFIPEVETGDKPPALVQAWGKLVEGDVSTAVGFYGEMIRKEQHLDQVISELREAAFLYPQEMSLHQALGDAYLRADRLQEALDAYNKAEELL